LPHACLDAAVARRVAQHWLRRLGALLLPQLLLPQLLLPPPVRLPRVITAMLVVSLVLLLLQWTARPSQT